MNIQSDLPDKHIEEFWYGLKKSILNVFYTIQLEIPFSIDDMSDELNQLQKQQNYSMIEKNIRNNIDLFCFYYMKLGISTYDSNILLSNIKRWNNISKKYSFHEKSDIRHINECCGLFSTYLKYISMKSGYIQELSDYFKNIEYKNYCFNKLVDICIQFNIYTYLDCLIPIYDVTNYINNKYNCNIHKNTKGLKIIKYLQNHKLI